MHWARSALFVINADIDALTVFPKAPTFGQHILHVELPAKNRRSLIQQH